MIHGQDILVEPTGVTFEPPGLPEETVQVLERMLMAVRDKDVSLNDLNLGNVGEKDRFEALSHLVTARYWYERSMRQREFELGWERVNEIGARGPGRALRLTGRWTVNDGTRTTHTCYPREMNATGLATCIEIHLEHCAQAF